MKEVSSRPKIGASASPKPKVWEDLDLDEAVVKALVTITPFVVIDEGLRLVRLGQALARSLGWEEREVRRKGMRGLCPEEDLELLYARVFSPERERSGQINFQNLRFKKKKGGQKHFDAVARRLSDNLVVLELQDMDSRTLDVLTGLLNYEGFIVTARSQLSSAERQRKRVILFAIDLDGLKAINDTYGHHAGNLAIQVAAEALKISFRKDDVIGRMGGDEFAVLTMSNGFEPEDLRLRFLSRLRSFGAKIKDADYSIDASVGFCSFDFLAEIQSVDLEKLLIEADKAMYSDKTRKNVSRITTTLNRGIERVAGVA